MKDLEKTQIGSVIDESKEMKRTYKLYHFNSIILNQFNLPTMSLEKKTTFQLNFHKWEAGKQILHA